MSSPRLSKAVKLAVIERAHGCCEYCWCQADYSPDPFSVDHILPRSRGGRNNSENLALACLGCNNRKHAALKAKDPVSKKMVPLFHPRQQIWAEHLVWNEDYTIISGITATGRATVEKLKLNRKSVVNLRRALATLNLHPPAFAGEPPAQAL